MPTRLPSAIVILFTLIVLKCLSSNYFPFCYALLSISGRAGRFSCKPKLRTQGSEKASVESSQDRDTQIFEAGENLGGSRAQTQTESGAALDVPPVRSNFARKNAFLPRLNAHKSELGNGKDFLIFD